MLKKRLNIIGGVADAKERNLDQRIKEITNLGEIIDAHTVFISYGERTQNERIPLIGHKVFTKMKCPEELFAHLN